MKVVPLADAVSEEIFGGKASALAHALRAGLPVPAGFALSWESVQSLVEGDEAASSAILSAYDGSRVAVRSSAIGEDSANASFAGQHLTLLNVASAASLLDAIRTIHASAHTTSVLEYRRKMSVAGAPRIAVVVMRMVDAETAGVLFTRNPITGANERVIESSWGLGEAVVSGLVTPDSFRVSAEGEILEKRAGRKDFVVRFAQAGGVVEMPVSNEDMTRLSLNDFQLRELHHLAARCEAHFGSPQDIEWAFEGERLYLLQSRPITVTESQQSAARITPHDDIGEETDSLQPLTVRAFAGLALAALLAPLNSTIIAVALPTISGALDVSAPMVTRWMVTAYLVVSIVAQSPAGKLADLWGTSRVLTLGRASFGFGALLAALAPTMMMLGTGRVLMALGGALAIPTVFAQLRNSVPAGRRGRVFGIFGAIMGGAAAVGPLIGGYLTATFGWHSIFLVNIPVVLLSFLLVPPRRSRSRARAPRFDIPGIAILGVAVILLVGAVERMDVVLMLASIAALAGFVVRELRADDPVLDVRLFSNPVFSAGSAIIALQNLTMYSMIFLLPFVLAQSGMAPAATGRMLLFFTLSMVMASPIGGRLSDALGARAIAFSGALIATLGATLFAEGGHLVLSLVLIGSGIGISTSPTQAAALGVIRAAQAGVASGALSTMRYLGGVIGSGIVALLVSGSVAGERGVLVFPVVLLVSAAAALILPGRRAR